MQKQKWYLSQNNINCQFQSMSSEALLSLIQQQKIFFIDSNKDYPKRAQSSSIQPIRNYINDLINKLNIDITSIPVLPASPQMPQWEHINAKFDTDYTDLKKSEPANILAMEIKNILNNNYQNHSKTFTDSSTLDSLSLKSAKILLLSEVFFTYSHLNYMQY